METTTIGINKLVRIKLSQSKKFLPSELMMICQSQGFWEPHTREDNDGYLTLTSVKMRLCGFLRKWNTQKFAVPTLGTHDQLHSLGFSFKEMEKLLFVAAGPRHA